MLGLRSHRRQQKSDSRLGFYFLLNATPSLGLNPTTDTDFFLNYIVIDLNDEFTPRMETQSMEVKLY